MQKKPNYQDRLRAYSLGVAGCGVALATGADAAVVDVTFEFGSTLDPADGGFVGSSEIIGGSVGNIGFYGGADFIALFAPSEPDEATGFYHNASYGPGSGLASYEDNGATHTFGSGALPNANGQNTAYFHAAPSPGADLGADATGVIGFRSDTGNWGYIEFDWDEASSTLTVLSAKAETEVNTPVTFIPIPEPSVMGLLSLGATGLLLRRRRSAK